MQILDYRRLFKDNYNYLLIGDGFLSFNNENKSEVKNGAGMTFLEFKPEEYCINTKNGFFLVCNSKTDSFYILKENNTIIKTFDTCDIFISPLRNYICHNDYEGESPVVKIFNYAGEWLMDFNIDHSYLLSLNQVNDDILCLQFAPYFDDRDFNKKEYFQTYVINIPQKHILMQGDFKDGYDDSLLSNVTYFELPFKIPQRFCSYGSQEFYTMYVPCLKCTVSEPYYGRDDEKRFTNKIYFSDFLGNKFKETNYAEISNLTNGYYIVKIDGFEKNIDLYGVLDSNFESFLPCNFPELKFDGDKIMRSNPSWSFWQDFPLDFKTKRFLAKRQHPDFEILLPYLYYSCKHEFIPNTDNSLLFAYKYTDAGEQMKGIIDMEGNEILPANFDHITQITDNLYELSCDRDKHLTLLYIDGKKVEIRNKYIKIETNEFNLDCSYLRVRVLDPFTRKAKNGLVNHKGIEIIPPKYDYIFFPREGRATYINEGRPGWINLEDLSTHEYPTFSVIKPFRNNRAIVGKDLVEIKCESIWEYETGFWDEYLNAPGYAKRRIDDPYGDIYFLYSHDDHEEGIINFQGEIIIEPIYEEIRIIEDCDKCYLVKQNHKWGVINLKEEELVPIIYDNYDEDVYDDDEYEGAIIKFWNDENIDFYDANWECLGSEESTSYNRRKMLDSNDYEDPYDYERDTFYALGGYDYDQFKRNGGSLDEMMEGMGLG